MNSTLFFKTKGQNYYFYDVNHSLFSYVHPLLLFIYNTFSDNPEILEELVKAKEGIIITPYGKFTYNDFSYYLERYKHLKSLHFFKNVVDNSSYENCVIESDTIQYYLSNIKQVTLEVTQVCNLKCRYCTYSELYKEFEKRKDISLSFVDVKKIFSILDQYWNSEKNIDKTQKVDVSFYGGEPLLNFNLIRQTVDFLSQSDFKKRFTYSLTTNGLLLDKHIDYFIENNFNLTVSLDGNEEHNQYRVDFNGNNSFKRFYDVISRIKNEFPVYFKERVQFNTVLHDANPIGRVEEFFLKEFDKIPLASGINSGGASIEGLSILSNMKRNYNENLKHYLSEERLFLDKDINVVLLDVIGFLRNQWENSMRHYMDFPFKKSEKMRAPTGSCPPFWKRLFLTTTGEILPCEKIGTRYSYGNINYERNLLGTGLDDVVDFHNKLIGNMLSQCKGCYHQRACEVCVYSQDIPEGELFVCDQKMDQNHFQNYLSKNYSFIEKHGAKVLENMNKVDFE